MNPSDDEGKAQKKEIVEFIAGVRLVLREAYERRLGVIMCGDYNCAVDYLLPEGPSWVIAECFNGRIFRPLKARGLGTFTVSKRDAASTHTWDDGFVVSEHALMGVRPLDELSDCEAEVIPVDEGKLDRPEAWKEIRYHSPVVVRVRMHTLKEYRENSRQWRTTRVTNYDDVPDGIKEHLSMRIEQVLTEGSSIRDCVRSLADLAKEHLETQGRKGRRVGGEDSVSRSLRMAIKECTSRWSAKTSAQRKESRAAARCKKHGLSKHQQDHWKNLETEEKTAAWVESVAEHQPGLLMSLVSGRAKTQTRISAVRVGDSIVFGRGPVHEAVQRACRSLRLKVFLSGSCHASLSGSMTC